MNAKTAKMLRQIAGVGNRKAYRELKVEWATLSNKERAARRRTATKAKDAKPAAAPAPESA